MNEEIKKLHKQGIDIATIAKACGTSIQVVKEVLHLNETPVKPTNENLITLNEGR